MSADSKRFVCETGSDGLLRKILTVFTGSSLTKLISFFSIWLIVQNYDPYEFGLFSVIDTLNGFFAGVIVTWLNWLLIQRSAKAVEKEQALGVSARILKLELLYAGGVGLLLLAAAGPIASLVFGKPELEPFVRISSIGMIGYTAVAGRSAVYQAAKSFHKDALFNIINSAAFLIAVVMLTIVLRGSSISAIALFYVSIPCLVSGYALSASGVLAGRGRVIERSSARFDPGQGWLLSYSLFLWIAAQVHLLVLTGARPLAELGAYAFASKIYLLALMVMNYVKTVLLPEFSACRTRELLRRKLITVVKLVSVVALVFIAAIPFAGVITDLIAGGRYADSAPVLRILLLGAAFSTALAPFAAVLFAEGRFKALAFSGLIMMLGNTLLQLLLTPRYGIISAAWILVGTNLAMNSVFMVLTSRILRGGPASPSTGHPEG
ncbi:MAG: oligosaccharide flippase family protein [Veillonellaceae bacterium]|nr:oligosaccharide flippase family protein [Veillonellaceae bacterium]